MKADGIEVTAIKVGSSWNASASGDATVSSVQMISYTANEVKAGDYIYSDGTTSDGGLRKRYNDSNTKPVIADPKPEPIAGKTVVGIVFWVPKDTETYSSGRSTPASLTSDKIMATDYPDCTHGLAVALKDVSYNMVWQTTPDFVVSFQNGANFNPANKSDYVTVEYSNANINQILGYQNTKVIKAYNDYIRSTDTNKLVKPVDALNSFSLAAPSGSTGWFIPSPKELHMLCYKDVDDIYNKSGSGWTETMDIVDASIIVAEGDKLNDNNSNYWSSTELTVSAFPVTLKNAYICSTHKTDASKVRAICAF